MNVLLFLRTVVRFQPSNKQFIFVLGVPRSGTSLLKNLLCAHSQLYGTSTESTGYFKFQNFGKYVFEGLSKKQTEEILQSSTDLVHAYERLASTVGGESCFVDKVTPAPWRYRLIRRCFPLASYVHIVRDGRDGYCSAIKHGGIKQANELDKWAKYWSDSVVLPERLLPSPSFITIRYEDLTNEPRDTMKMVMEFLGYQFEEGQIDPHEYEKTSSLHKSRSYHRNLAKPISPTSVNRYRTQLSLRQVKVFNQIAGTQLSRLGYEI